MASITFSHVGKLYDDKTRAIDDLDLRIEDGEFVVLVGPSGCGKTTALRMVAGLEEISEGEIRIGDEVINTLDPGRRDVAMVFQNYALYPHMSVFENIAFPLRSRRLPRDEVRTRVARTAKALGLTEMLQKKPRTLSGGQRQRVAMGRAIVREPKAFLMDEPLSNLDAKLRVQMRAEISRLQHELGVTTIYVTHDQVEAMTMGSRIAVMRRGVLQQEGAPQELYDRPANLFVASFIGSPAMNLVRGRIERNGSGLVCRLGDQTLPLPSDVARYARFVDREVAIGVRPEHLHVDRDDLPTVSVAVTLTETLGPEGLLHVTLAADPVLTEDVLDVARDVDATAMAELQHEASGREVRLVSRVDPRHRFTSGERLDVGVAADALHLFDLKSGQAI